MWLLFAYPIGMALVFVWAAIRIKRDDKLIALRWRAISFTRRYVLLRRLTRNKP